MSFIIKPPYLPQTDTEIKFETYRFYLQSICGAIHNEHRTSKQLGLECLRRTQRLQVLKNFDMDWIERWMKIAWNTEYLLSVGSDDPELIRISNQWKPIQQYYAVYACTEAAAYVLDGEKADGHQKSLRKITAYFVQVGISPWNKAFKGSRGRKGNEHFAVNFPQDIIIPHNLQRVDVKPLEMIAKCLKAEHTHRIDELFQKRPGIYKYNFDPGYTGLFHFLYRLRVKSNYKDVEIFVTEAPEENIRSFSESLDIFCFCCLLYMEIILIRKCRKKCILDLGEKYLKLNSKACHLAERLELYRNNI